MALISSSNAERKQLIYNKDAETARSIAETAISHALVKYLEEANDSESEIFNWFRGSNDAEGAKKTLDVEEDVLACFPELEREPKVHEVEISMHEVNGFKNQHELDSGSKEKHGIIVFKSKVKYGKEKRQIEKGHDFKVVLITLPRIKDGDLESGEKNCYLNHFALLIREGTTYIDREASTNSPMMEIVNDENAGGFLSFGRKNGKVTDYLQGVSEYLSGDSPEGASIAYDGGNFRYKNTDFIKFYTKRIFYNEPAFSNISKAKLIMPDRTKDREKFARMFPAGDDLFGFALRKETLELDGMIIVDTGFNVPKPINYRGYCLTMTNNKVVCNNSIAKKTNDSGWFIFNGNESGGDASNIELAGTPSILTATFSALFGEITRINRRPIKIAGSLHASSFYRSRKGIISASMERDPSILFPFSSVTKDRAYSVSISHAPSYYKTMRHLK